MIELILKIAIIVWPFGQLLRFSHLGLNFYLLDLLLFLLALVTLITHRGKVTSDRLFKPLILFLLTAGLSLLFAAFRLPPRQIILAALYLFRLWTYPFIYFALKLVDFKKIKTTLLASLLLFLAFGLIQYLFFPDARDLKYLGFDDHYYRLIGTIFDPNYVGLVLSLLSLILLVNGNYLLFGISLISLVLTFSRASYLTFLLGLTLTYLLKKPKLVLSLFLALIALVVIAPKPFGEGVNLLRTFSIYSRLNSSLVGLELFVQRPLFGWGYNTLTNLSGQRLGIDNSFVYLMATTGGFGLLSFIYLLTQIYCELSTNTKILVSLILFHSLFNNSFFFIYIHSLLWLLVGIDRKLRAQN